MIGPLSKRALLLGAWLALGCLGNSWASSHATVADGDQRSDASSARTFQRTNQRRVVLQKALAKREVVIAQQRVQRLKAIAANAQAAQLNAGKKGAAKKGPKKPPHAATLKKQMAKKQALAKMKAQSKKQAQAKHKSKQGNKGGQGYRGQGY